MGKPRPLGTASLPTSKRSSLRLFPLRRNLGSKLQLLGELSPAHVRIIESLVDLILRKLGAL